MCLQSLFRLLYACSAAEVVGTGVGGGPLHEKKKCFLSGSRKQLPQWVTFSSLDTLILPDERKKKSQLLPLSWTPAPHQYPQASIRQECQWVFTLGCFIIVVGVIIFYFNAVLGNRVMALCMCVQILLSCHPGPIFIFIYLFYFFRNIY